MAMAVSSNEGKSYSDINMTPLIDVMLVLLIIFIITIPSQTHAVKIDNPSAHEPPPTRPEVIDLSIDFDGTLLWNKTPVDRADAAGLYQSRSHQESAARSAHHGRQILQVRNRGANLGGFTASRPEEDRVRQQRYQLADWRGAGAYGLMSPSD